MESSTEAIERAWACYLRIDTDKNSAIDFQEFTKIMRYFEPQISQKSTLQFYKESLIESATDAMMND